MKRRPPPIEKTEQPDQATLDRIDDGELCSYEVVDGKLVETVTRPARRPGRAARRR